jgi:hypothetical protein
VIPKERPIAIFCLTHMNPSKDRKTRESKAGNSIPVSKK